MLPGAKGPGLAYGVECEVGVVVVWCVPSAMPQRGSVMAGVDV